MHNKFVLPSTYYFVAYHYIASVCETPAGVLCLKHSDLLEVSASVEVIRITPRGYCYGVVDAIQMAKLVAKDPKYPRPIYILGMIVHNRHAVSDLDELGIVTLDGDDRLALLDEIDSGTVIFTAHGVAPQVIAKAKEKGLTTVDATCPDVTRTHHLVRELAEQGYQVLYVGKRGHPEPEGVRGEAPDHVHLIETVADVDALQLDTDKLAVTTQTTLSKWDTQAIIDYCIERFPQIEVFNEICLATQERQEAAAEQAKEADVVLVVGDVRSNNSQRLVQVVEELAGRPAYLVDNVDAIKMEWLHGAKKVGVTAGSSTPTYVTRGVIEFIENLDPAVV